MNNLPKTLRSYEADIYIITSTQGRELFRAILNRFVWYIYKDIDTINNNVELELNIEYLSQITQLNKKTIQKHRAVLSELGLIKVSRNKIKVCINYYLSLVNLFCNLDKKSYADFSNAISAHDTDLLNNLGYAELNIEEMKEILIILLYSKNPSYIPKVGTNEESYIPNLGINGELHPKFGYYLQQNQVTSQIWVLTNGEIQSYIPNLGISEESYIPNLGSNSENWESMFMEICKFIGVNTQKWDVSDETGVESLDLEAIESPENKIAALGMYHLAYMLQQVLIKNELKNPNLGIISSFLHPTFTPIINNIYNKYNNINNIERSEILQKENKEKVFLEENMEASDESSSDFLKIIELEDKEPFGRSQIKHKDKHSQEILKNKTEGRYDNKPFYSQEDFKSITASLDPDETVKSPVRLFFYIFWWGLWDLYSAVYNPEDYDEEGNPVEDEGINDLKMLGATLPVEDIMNLLSDTYDNLEGAVEKGFYEDQYGSYEIGFSSFEKFIPHQLVCWEQGTMPDGTMGLKISLEGIRNIEAPDISKLKKPVGKTDMKTERKLSQSMITLIRKFKLEQLTPIEQVLKMFLEEFGVFDDYNHLVSFQSTKSMYIPPEKGRKGKGETILSKAEVGIIGRQLYLQPLVTIAEKVGISVSLFFQALTKRQSQDTIKCSGALFSFTKVANINAENGWKSLITSSKASETA